MPPEGDPAEDPQEWLARARSNLIRAEARTEGVYLEDLCFDAQQAVEKALKGLLLATGREAPRTHNIGVLLQRLEQSGVAPPEELTEAVILTDYAVQARYPGVGEPVTEDEYDHALWIARTAMSWVERQLEETRGGD